MNMDGHYLLGQVQLPSVYISEEYDLSLPATINSLLRAAPQGAVGISGASPALLMDC